MRGDPELAAISGRLDARRPTDATISVGTVIAKVARVYGIVTVNACRIVNAIDEPNRFGFAYGTLPGHVERGEERFLVERKDNGDVWYEILAYSRPRHWLARIGYPLARLQQARFRRGTSRGRCKRRSSR